MGVGKQIEILHAGRGVACLAVVAVHANSYAPVSEVFSLGRYGVHFFFLLSGYVIFTAATQVPFHIQKFATARMRRVYLPYLPVGLAAAIGYVLLGRPVDWLASLTLLPGETALIPAWTLQREIVFYAFATLVFAARAPLVGCLIWAAAIGARAASTAPLSPIEAVVLDPLNLLFIVGMFLAKLKVAPEWRMPQTLMFLGEASYSIYLIHLPLMGIMWRAGAGFEMLVLGGVIAGVLYHMAIEKPLLSGLKHRSLQRASTSLETPLSRTPSQSFPPLPARR